MALVIPRKLEERYGRQKSGHLILVTKDRMTKAAMALVMPRKCADPYAIESEA